MLLGLADDRRGLDWRLRLAVQTLVAVVLVCLGWRMSLFLDMPWLTGALSVLWIVGLVNSFNMLDNMDGLSAGVAAIAAAMLAAVMLLTPRPDNNQPQLFVAGLLLVIVGSLLGFLWHNRPPARLFMGDAGSYLVGYLLAMATLTATFAGGDLPKHAILAPLCVLAVPLYDTASVVLIRLRSGRSPLVGDKSHFSHRLVELGMTQTQAVLTIYLATATCGLGALLLRQVNRAGAMVVLLMVVCTLAAGRHSGNRRPPQAMSRESARHDATEEPSIGTCMLGQAQPLAALQQRPLAALAAGRHDGALRRPAALPQRVGGPAWRRPDDGHAVDRAGHLLAAGGHWPAPVRRPLRLDRRRRVAAGRLAHRGRPLGHPARQSAAGGQHALGMDRPGAVLFCWRDSSSPRRAKPGRWPP